MTEKIFHLQEWTPDVMMAAQDIIDRVHSAAPELQVLFMGAAALRLPGKNDIDLDILCAADDAPRYTGLLTPILGEPKQTKIAMTSWEFMHNGFEVDCLLSDPTTSHVPRQMRMFEILKADDELRRDYEKLKRDCDGLPYDEYERLKKAFFAEVLGRYSPG